MNSSVLAEERKKIVIMGKKLKKIIDDEHIYVKYCLREDFMKPIKKGTELIGHLESLFSGQLPQKDEPVLRLGKGEMFKKFEGEITRLVKTDSQTMAFRQESITNLYQKRIVKMGKFVLHRKSKLFYDLSSTGTVNFELILPFQDTDLQAGNDCASSTDLPHFFREHSPN